MSISLDLNDLSAPGGLEYFEHKLLCTKELQNVSGLVIPAPLPQQVLDVLKREDRLLLVDGSSASTPVNHMYSASSGPAIIIAESITSTPEEKLKPQKRSKSVWRGFQFAYNFLDFDGGMLANVV